MSLDRFDLEKVHSYFQDSLKDEDDVLMDHYLNGYKEINKFFHLMGSVFGFVSNDVKSKVEILEEHRKKENCHKFETFKIMMEYERDEQLLYKSDYESGSRTLLRLHRGLDFIRAFLFKVGQLSPADKTSAVCQAAYNDTLAKHHSWIIRKGAVVAMYAMPTREQLLKKVCSDVEKTIAVLPEMLEITEVVFNRTNNLYSEYDLHGLS